MYTVGVAVCDVCNHTWTAVCEPDIFIETYEEVDGGNDMKMGMRGGKQFDLNGNKYIYVRTEGIVKAYSGVDMQITVVNSEGKLELMLLSLDRYIGFGFVDLPDEEKYIVEDINIAKRNIERLKYELENTENDLRASEEELANRLIKLCKNDG